jgi:hypothetical protein
MRSMLRVERKDCVVVESFQVIEMPVREDFLEDFLRLFGRQQRALCVYRARVRSKDDRGPYFPSRIRA